MQAGRTRLNAVAAALTSEREMLKRQNEWTHEAGGFWIRADVARGLTSAPGRGSVTLRPRQKHAFQKTIARNGVILCIPVRLSRATGQRVWAGDGRGQCAIYNGAKQGAFQREI